MSQATLDGSVMQDAGEHRVLFSKLIKASHNSYIDLNTTIPWRLGTDRSRLPKAENQMWLYGTGEAHVTRAHLRALVGQLHYVYNYNPETARCLSFELPYDGTDAKLEHVIRRSAHNTELNAVRFADITGWCKTLGII